MSNKNEKKTFKLEDLEVESFVTTLTEDEQADLLGGHGVKPDTKCSNPAHCPKSIALQDISFEQDISFKR